MSKTKVYISDFDFTLLKSDLSLPSNLGSFLQRCEERNLYFTVATARSIYSLDEIMNGYKFYLPIIEFNGGYVTDHKTMRPYHIQSIPQSIVKEIYKVADQHGISPIVSCYNEMQVVYPPLEASDGIQDYVRSRKQMGDMRLQLPANFDDLSVQHVMTTVFIDTQEILEPFYTELLQKGLDVSIHYYMNKYTQYYWLTIHDKYSTKEAAILRLMDQLHLDRQNTELIVFGDDVNDMGMFELADHSVAVGNAKPELKEIADEIIGTNDEESVIAYITNMESL